MHLCRLSVRYTSPTCSRTKCRNHGRGYQPVAQIQPQYCPVRRTSIIATWNRVIHGYDSVTPEFLWSLIINHIPRLRQEVSLILEQD
ncbi:MAG: DUF86 domain-containing protein [Bacteroidales bacterium]|nr:DUF86 domain-containing protein [Bacteroidales bacterium]